MKQGRHGNTNITSYYVGSLTKSREVAKVSGVQDSQRKILQSQLDRKNKLGEIGYRT